jgi:DNA-binding GntR family transcriptional regulator
MPEPALTLVQTKSLADQVADSIVEGIATGAIVPGQRILEVELASRLRVSRVPVREALKILHAQGIVMSRPHHGVRVARFDDRKIFQIYEVRCCLEKIAVRDACRHRSAKPTLLSGLDAVIDRMERSLDRDDLIGVSKADLEFHHQICLASGHEIVITLWEALSRHMLIVFEQELLGDAERAHIVDHHRALRKAIEMFPPQKIAVEIERHIMRLRGKPRRPRRIASVVLDKGII